MAQRASLRDQTSLTVEKRRSNRTVYVLRSGSRAACTVTPVSRADGSKRGGQGLPGPRGRKTTGEPARSNRRRMKGFPRRRGPTLSFGAAAARAPSKSSLKGGHPEENVGRLVRARRHRSDRGSGLCAPTPAAFALRPYTGWNGHEVGVPQFLITSRAAQVIRPEGTRMRPDRGTNWLTPPPAPRTGISSTG